MVVADLDTCICAYLRDSVRETRRLIGWRLNRGLSARASCYPTHNFIGFGLILILISASQPRWSVSLESFHLTYPDMLRMSQCCSNFPVVRCTYVVTIQL